MQLLCDQEHTDGAVLGRAAGMGSGSGGQGDLVGSRWHRGTSQDGTLGVGHWGGASVRAHGLARGGVRACVRDSVC